jgi:hypothetical protein
VAISARVASATAVERSAALDALESELRRRERAATEASEGVLSRERTVEAAKAAASSAQASAAEAQERASAAAVRLAEREAQWLRETAARERSLDAAEAQGAAQGEAVRRAEGALSSREAALRCAFRGARY